MAQPVDRWTGKTVLAIVEQWKTDIEAQEKSFVEQATQVLEWQRQVWKNRQSIGHIRDDLEKVKQDEANLTNEIGRIQKTQEQLKEEIDALQKNIQDVQARKTATEGESVRDASFQLAEDIDKKLETMNGSLEETLQRIKMVSQQSQGPNSLTDIIRTLHHHTNTLTWVMNERAVLRQRLDDAV